MNVAYVQGATIVREANIFPIGRWFCCRHQQSDDMLKYCFPCHFFLGENVKRRLKMYIFAKI